jgi:hypothetical protein
LKAKLVSKCSCALLQSTKRLCCQLTKTNNKVKRLFTCEPARKSIMADAGIVKTFPSTRRRDIQTRYRLRRMSARGTIIRLIKKKRTPIPITM